MANAKEEAARAKLTAEANALKESILQVSRLKSANKQGNRNYPSELVRQNLASYTGVKKALKTHQKKYNAIVDERRKRLAKSFNIKQMFEPNRNKIDKLIKTVRNARNESKVNTEIVEALNKYKIDAKKKEALVKKIEPLVGSLSTETEKNLVKEYIANPTEATKKAALDGIRRDSLERGPAPQKRQQIYRLLGGKFIQPIAQPTKRPRSSRGLGRGGSPMMKLEDGVPTVSEESIDREGNKPRTFGGNIKPGLNVYRGK